MIKGWLFWSVCCGLAWTWLLLAGLSIQRRHLQSNVPCVCLVPVDHEPFVNVAAIKNALLSPFWSSSSGD